MNFLNQFVSKDDVLAIHGDSSSKRKKKNKKQSSEEELQEENQDDPNTIETNQKHKKNALNTSNDNDNEDDNLSKLDSENLEEGKNKLKDSMKIPDSKSLKKNIKNSIFKKIPIISNVIDSEESTQSEDVGSHSYWYRGECFQLVDDWESELENYAQIVLEQKIELIEVIRKCETINRYNIYHISQENNVKQFLFKCKDTTNCLFRNFCPSVSRPVQFQVLHIDDSTRKPNYRNSDATFQKNCIPACLPCFKPTTIIYLNERIGKGISKKKIGRVVEVTGCSIQFLIQNSQGIDKWKIYGKYCQCGFCCKCTPMGQCYIADFFIYDARADVKSANPVGSIQKVFQGLSDVISNSNALIINFPTDATPYEKLVFICATMMIDYRYYDEVGCDFGNVL